MRIRRLAGAATMSVGALATAFFATLGIAVIANYLEPENLADAVGTLLVLTGPGLLAGLAAMGIGRIVYGGWKDKAPLLHAARILLPVAGLGMAAVFCVLLVALFATGFGPEDGLSALKHALGVAAGACGLLAGRMLPRPTPSGRPA